MISATGRFAGAILLAAAMGYCAPVRFKDRCLADLTAQIPGILKSQDPATGRFGKGIWIVTDQNLLLPLAAAWSYKSDANPYYHKPELLNAIMSGGDALIADQDKNGQWVFRKKDGSTWGNIYMPWTYSRWIRAFSLVRDAMPQDRREKWEKALLLGFSGIADEVSKARVQNIPSHHAMALYFAGMVFDKPEWRELSKAYLHRVAEAQHSDGYWTEHVGPVVNYGFVYVDALGTYLGVSHDEFIRPYLKKSANFHAHFTYPDGTPVETVDERNPYHGGVTVPNIGFSFSPEGRSYFAHQLAIHKGRISADEAASLLLWGEEGEGAPESATGDFDYSLPSGDAAVRRRGPWFVVVSALTAAQSNSRWIQDRQNFVSIYHDKAGVILGGGNTKMQPRWSNFTVGDVNLLQHKAGDENPKFIAPGGLIHVPTSAKVIRSADDFGLDLDYNGKRARILLKIVSPDRLEYSWSGDSSMTAHVTLLPRPDNPKQNPDGSLDYGKVHFALPKGTTLQWPVLPHNPYRKDGAAEPSEGRLVLDSPVSGTQTITLQIMK